MDERPIKSIIEIYRRTFIIITKNLPALFLVAILVKLFIQETKNSPKDILNSPNGLLILGGIGATLFTFFLKYLESDKTVDKNSDRLKGDINELRLIVRNLNKNTFSEKEILDELKTLKESVIDSNSKGLDLNDADKLQLFELLETKLEKNLSKEFLENIQQKFGAEILATERYSDLQDDLITFKERINSEIRKLSLRANTNLSIGSVTTLIAVIVLYITVVTNHPVFSDSISLTSYFVPRITLVIFIEVFAFFFLKLYKSNLDNIRYYHNEMTNIEMKIVALKASIINSDKPTINGVVKEISKTERNFIIKKGETTIDLERIRNENADNKSVIDFAKSFLAKKTEKKTP